MPTTILVVEDEPMLLLDLSGQLRRAGFDVIEATTGDEAQALLKKGAKVDVVCTDVRMPGMLNGVMLARWVKAEKEALPVIVVSGEITGRDLPGVADARFVKPVDVGRLVEKVRELAGRYA